MDLITIKAFDESMQAHLVKSKLESEGIDVWLLDDHSVSVQPWASFALGGVKLQVRESDVEKAIELLKGFE